MTWKEAWKRGAQSLQKAGVEEYDLDAWYLLEHVTGITKASYYMEPEHPMHDQEEREYGNSVGCVQKGTDGRNPTLGYVHRFRVYSSESPA